MCGSCDIGTVISYVNLDGCIGIVIPPENNEALAASMGRLFDGQNLTQQFGRNARQRYLANVSAEQMAAASADLCQRFAGRGNWT